MTLGEKVLTIVTAVALITAWRGQHSAKAERFQRINAEAKADTTVRYLRGQLQVASRLIVQGPVKPDGVTVSGHRMAHALVTIPADTVRIQDTLWAVPDLPFRVAVDTEGLHLRMKITPPPPVWAWDGAMWRDSVSIAMTLSCKNGAARATVTGPAWQPIGLTELQQDPNICNPPPKWSALSLKPPSLIWIAGGVIAALLVLR